MRAATVRRGHLPDGNTIHRDKRAVSVTVLTCALAQLLQTAHGLNNGLALTPPMGFANWNGYSCGYTDATFRQQACALASPHS